MRYQNLQFVDIVEPVLFQEKQILDIQTLVKKSDSNIPQINFAVFDFHL